MRIEPRVNKMQRQYENRDDRIKPVMRAHTHPRPTCTSGGRLLAALVSPSSLPVSLFSLVLFAPNRDQRANSKKSRLSTGGPAGGMGNPRERGIRQRAETNPFFLKKKERGHENILCIDSVSKKRGPFRVVAQASSRPASSFPSPLLRRAFCSTRMTKKKEKGRHKYAHASATPREERQEKEIY